MNRKIALDNSGKVMLGGALSSKRAGLNNLRFIDNQ